MSFLVAVLLIGTIILVHELGHFVVARGTGIPVSQFSIGFGPKLASFCRGETEYRLGAIPLGGYVLPDLDEEEFLDLPAGRRIAFALGGPLANVLLTVLALAAAGLLANGWSWSGLLMAPLRDTALMAWTLLSLIPQLLLAPGQMQGVVGIVGVGGQFVDAGLVAALQFTALLSLNLGVLNLLPIPPLDGGKIVLTLLEKILPATRRAWQPLTLLGVLLLFGLMGYVTVMDLVRLA